MKQFTSRSTCFIATTLFLSACGGSGSSGGNGDGDVADPNNPGGGSIGRPIAQIVPGVYVYDDFVDLKDPRLPDDTLQLLSFIIVGPDDTFAAIDVSRFTDTPPPEVSQAVAIGEIDADTDVATFSGLSEEVDELGTNNKDPYTDSANLTFNGIDLILDTEDTTLTYDRLQKPDSTDPIPSSYAGVYTVNTGEERLDATEPANNPATITIDSANSLNVTDSLGCSLQGQISNLSRHDDDSLIIFDWSATRQACVGTAFDSASELNDTPYKGKGAIGSNNEILLIGRNELTSAAYTGSK